MRFNFQLSANIYGTDAFKQLSNLRNLEYFTIYVVFGAGCTPYIESSCVSPELQLPFTLDVLLIFLGD